MGDRAVGAVLLAGGEIITNPGKYTPGPFLLELELRPGPDADDARVTVWDADPVLPVPHEPDPAAGRPARTGDLPRAVALLALGRRAGGRRISALNRAGVAHIGHIRPYLDNFSHF